MLLAGSEPTSSGISCTPDSSQRKTLCHPQSGLTYEAITVTSLKVAELGHMTLHTTVLWSYGKITLFCSCSIYFSLNQLEHLIFILLTPNPNAQMMLTYSKTQLDKQPWPCQSENFFLLAIEIESGIAHNPSKGYKTQIFWNY